MLPKALWKKEWKHVSLIAWGILIIFLLEYPFKASMKIEEWKEEREHYVLDWEWNNFLIHQMEYSFTASVFTVFAVVLIIVLAGILIGLERSSKRHDFSLALPFSKRSMFLTKWVLGFATILFSYTVSFWLGYLVLLRSEYGYVLTELDVTTIFFAPLAAYFVIFSLAMLIGTIAGDMRSQVTLSFIFLFFAQGFSIILLHFLATHGLIYFDYVLPPFLQDIFWPTYLTSMNIAIADLIYPIIGGVIFFIVGMLLFEKAPAEHSGEFLVFRSLHPIFAFGILISSALAGGLLMTTMISFGFTGGINVLSYWIGAIVAGGFSWIIIKRLLQISK
ncbi:ABC-2 type transport system permease protein [Salirhabdus euzebyi]|uniref:ABC-2 type transport system permease protein n=1 Tax=Salirhabdus euzebyi TaxID=394506 RepID=A0A841Q578_9BACI|nr:ABC transporter permease subunit [Salirhabdus euzebyi]MBB6453513.1 ABC-2 type transport system permease protein [Salirhabdus euzebyi]